MILEIFRKCSWSNHNDSDNRLPITDLINETEVVILEEFDSLKHEILEELGYEKLLKEVIFDENKADIGKYI